MDRPLFQDRADAGRALARLLERYAGRPDVVVLALPRGGVPVAFEVAAALRAPLDVLVVRKLGVPGHEEYAMGALAAGVRVLDDALVRRLGLSPREVEAVVDAEQRELERRERLYRGEAPAPELAGRTVLVVDDGLATGSTMRAAVRAVRGRGPARVVVAVPVGAADTCAALRDEADEVACVASPEPFEAVGIWYEDFGQTGDDEVRALLARARRLA
ncbi:MAG: phosphoribosyltransferase [Burkholderiaceae bacterium]